MRVFRIFVLGLATLASCGVERSSDDLTIQFSSTETADYLITLTDVAEFSPSCRIINQNETVQWRNNNENIPVRVVSTGEPFELVSPMLRGDFAEWSHTFSTTGIFDYYDPFSGDLGRPVHDAYYGTTTFVGESGTVTRGRVCVRADASDATTCANQCCPLGTDGECANSQTCQDGLCRDAS